VPGGLILGGIIPRCIGGIPIGGYIMPIGGYPGTPIGGLSSI